MSLRLPQSLLSSPPATGLLAHERGWDVQLYNGKVVEDQAARILGERAGEVLHGPRTTLGPPWAKDHRMALAATIVAG